MDNINKIRYRTLLEQIFNMYIAHTYRQREIADHYDLPVTDISYILQSFGFHRCKLQNIESVEKLLEDNHILKILNKIK